MKRFLAMLSLFCLALLPAAQAETIANQLPVVYASDELGPADALTDNNPATVWYLAENASDTPTVTLLLASQTVREIWVRAGAHSSPNDYLAAGRPETIAVTLYYSGNQMVTYRYRLIDSYTAPNSRDWVNDYQRLLLPEALGGVFSIELTVERTVAGRASAAPAISDILVSAGQPSQAASAVQFRPSAPTVAPQATVVPVVPTGAPTAQPGANPTDPPPAAVTEVPPPAVVTEVPPPVTGDAGIVATLSDRIATRTGPGTEYDEPGSFFQAGAQVQVVSKVYDAENELYWYLVDFSSGGTRYRVYALASRISLEPSLVPDEAAASRATILDRTSSYYGPGTDYKAHTDTIAGGTVGAVCATTDNGWVLFDWYDDYQGLQRRAWIPESSVSVQ